MKCNRKLMSILLVLALCLGLSAPALAKEDDSAGEVLYVGRMTTETYRYVHDPMENPKAAADLVESPDAVYGYSPNPASKRLGVYADAIDWTDASQVASARADRAAYHAKNQELYELALRMKAAGNTTEQIARAVSRRRNELRLEAYNGDPEGLALVKKSNFDTYGNEEGPTAESLFEKYGSWQTVLEKAFSSNPGMDACLGFYDALYDTYDFPEAQSQAALAVNPVTGAAL